MTLWALALAEVVPLVVLLAGELRERRRWVWVAKPLASALFVVAGVLFLPWPASSSSFLFAGLLLSVAGDVLLIPKGKRATFLVGLGCFLGAHIAYAIAFSARGVDRSSSARAGAVLLVAGAPLLRWLLPHVRGSMRGPVLGYVVAIGAMVSLAVGAWQAGARVTLPLGAVVFLVSDLYVARERFVTRSRWNGTIGLPLYYGAQFLLVHGLGHP